MGFCAYHRRDGLRGKHVEVLLCSYGDVSVTNHNS